MENKEKGSGAGSRKNDPNSLELLRVLEKGLLKVNDVFGPPITVKNRISLKWLQDYRRFPTSSSAFDQWFAEWLEKELREDGYRRIADNRAFTRLADGEWEKEYKIVATC